jgi:hypothetical protein
VLLRVGEEVKDNLVKALHNLMCDSSARDGLVRAGHLSCFLKLVASEASDTRELASATLLNLSYEGAYHDALLDAGLMQTLGM